MTHLLQATISALAIGFVLGFLIALPLVFTPWSRRKKRYQQLIEQHDLGTFFPVRYCTDRRYRKWLKIFPWEGVGFVKRTDDMVEFRGFPNKGRPFKIDSSADSIGNHGTPSWFRNGLLPWLKLKDNTDQIYFAAESGPFIFGTGFQNSVLLNHLKKHKEQDGGRK